jgi:hypothetical protein
MMKPDRLESTKKLPPEHIQLPPRHMLHRYRTMHRAFFHVHTHIHTYIHTSHRHTHTCTCRPKSVTIHCHMKVSTMAQMLHQLALVSYTKAATHTHTHTHTHSFRILSGIDTQESVNTDMWACVCTALPSLEQKRANSASHTTWEWLNTIIHCTIIAHAMSLWCYNNTIYIPPLQWNLSITTTLGPKISEIERWPL